MVMKCSQPVSKIYSRKRMRRFKPRQYNWQKNKSKNSKFRFFIATCIVAILICLVITKSAQPVFDKVCLNEARSIAVKIINDESTKAIENYNYNDLYTIERDSSRKHTNDKCQYFKY